MVLLRTPPPLTQNICCSVIQLCPTLCDPMDSSTPGFPFLHHLPELTQTHVHWVGDAIQPSHPLSSPSPTFSHSQHQGIFKWVSSSRSGGQSIGVSASTSVLPMNTQDWSPLGWTGWISWQSKELSRVLLAVQGTLKSLLQHHSLKTSILWHSAFLMVQLTSIHDYWKNHSFD